MAQDAVDIETQVQDESQVSAVLSPKYKVAALDYDSVKESKLCGIVDEEGNLIGTGIPKMKSSDTIVMIVDGEKYTFDNNGNPIDSKTKSKGYKLNMAASLVEANTTGTVGATSAAYTRRVSAETGDVTYTPSGILDKTYEITIDNLNARDQFALQALHTIMEKIPNPDELSKDEITHYCEASYLWASYMMVESSKARAVIEDADTSDNTKTETVGYLESNTEKLLNNIVAAIERNDIKEVVNGSEIYSDRIAIPKLMDFLDAYVKDGNTTLGLKDLIKAIKDSGDSGSGEVDIKTIPNINIGNTGLGRDADHPIFMSGGGFPSRQVLGSAFTEAIIHDFLTFNEAGAVGYSTKAETKKALLGFLNDYADITGLSTAVLTSMVANDIYAKIQSNIDTRVKAWLNATTIVADGDGWKLNVPNSI